MFVTSAMHVLVAAAVFVMLLCCGVLGSSLNTALSDDVASLLDRMEAQESLNQEQTTKLLRHEDKLSEQDKLLARQDGTLLQQGRLIHQLRSEVAASRASVAISRASVAISRASAWADTKPTARHVNVVDVMGVLDPETPDSRTDSAVPGRIVAKRSDSVHNVAKRAAAGQNVTKQSASRRHVVKRSDDVGPLEVVVNRISQWVTELGAEFQALKAQTTSDLNALSIKTTSDLQNLRTQSTSVLQALRTQTTSDLQALKNQTTANLEALKNQTTADVQTLQNSDRQQDQNIHDARTSTFVRWGSSTCGKSSSLVYSGIVGGSWYGDTGAAADYLCLTLSPVPSQRYPPSGHAKVFGAEYQTSDYHNDKDPLCAVCRAAFSTTVMVPGTDTCSPGWHRHYSGFLMAGAYDHTAATQYICVDQVMESSSYSDADQNGRLLYFTVTECGSLPCGPYVNNKVVTCAVCSM